MNNDIKEYTTPSGEKRYKFLIYVGRDETTGRTIQIKKQGFKTEKEALESYLNYQLKVVKGEYVPITKRKLRLNDLYDQWIKLYKTTVQESTFVSTKKIFDNHILKQLGNIYLNKLNVSQCQTAVNTWFNEAPKTFKRFVFYASKLINYGITMELIKKNPMKKVILPKVERDTSKFTDFYSKDELNTFLNDAKGYNFRYFMFFRLLAYSGMRKGECLALKWSDIDFKNKTININKSLASGENNRLYLSPCKNKSSVRLLDMDAQTMDYLKEWRTKQQKEMFKLGMNFLSDDNLLFANSKGTYTVLSKPQRWDNAICKKFGLRHIKVHGFRHTHASLLFDAGVSMKDVKERLGHSDITTTMNIYTHVTKKEAKKTAVSFANYMES
ncbi:tyrosine-type recombinase/integrase [Lactobacillus helveticus]|uniref:Tyrosine recombinase XerC n=1 Tax=Lactobacillus helveticus TaxID=1587 RepID=A0A9Q5C4K5_LACHE|nr:tyrosine-type recombinase/integrase [Lactobacillus helveticus]NRO34947.1 Tyrosine recombinase XerC [Lactobacillus helveticus]